MEAVVITLRADKPADHKDKILFINAVNEYTREQAQSFLRDTHQKKILHAYRDFTDIDQFAAVATLDQIAAKGYNLAIPLYVTGATTTDTGGQLDVIDAVANWRTAADTADQAITDIITHLRNEASL